MFFNQIKCCQSIDAIKDLRFATDRSPKLHTAKKHRLEIRNHEKNRSSTVQIYIPHLPGIYLNRARVRIIVTLPIWIFILVEIARRFMVKRRQPVSSIVDCVTGPFDAEIQADIRKKQ